MKISTTLVFFVLILGTEALAQDARRDDSRQQLNGTWSFDPKRSKPNDEDLYGVQILQISYKEPELKIVKTRTRGSETNSATLILYTDRRGEKNRPYPFNQNLELESTTEWVKDILVRTFTVKFYKSGKVVGGLQTRQSYSVSDDGDTLTIIEEFKGKSSSNYGEVDHKGRLKEVYKKKK